MQFNYINLHALKLLTENIFDLRNYFDKDFKKNLDQANDFLDKKIKKLSKKINLFLIKNYGEIYKKIGLKDGLYFISSKKDKKEIELMSLIISQLEKNKVTIGDIEKRIFERSCGFGSSYPYEVEIDGKKRKIFIAFVAVPEITFWRRLLPKYADHIMVNSIFNHPKWTSLLYKIIIFHELTEIEESIIYKRNDFKTGWMLVKFKNGNLRQIGHHFSILVLAKEAIILNKYKNIPALNKLRNLRFNEWKMIKALSGVDLSILKKLDKKTEEKLLKIKTTKFKIPNEKKKREGVVTTEDQISNTKIAGLINNKEPNLNIFKRVLNIFK